jgi:hypothetical protein
MTSKRKPISKKTRFEVFKRDSFTCQYCGRSAPDVVLHVDHINPVSKGGTDDVLNYITSCKDCNQGKSNKELSDKTLLQKQKAQLDELSERREQLKLMVRWRDGLLKLQDESIKVIQDRFEAATNCTLTEFGITAIRKWLKKYSLKELLDAMDRSIPQYYNSEIKGSSSKVLDYIPRIASCTRLEINNPELKSLFYLRGIMRNRYNYCSDYQAIDLLKRGYEACEDMDLLKRIVFDNSTWSGWRSDMESLIGEER